MREAGDRNIIQSIKCQAGTPKSGFVDTISHITGLSTRRVSREMG